MTAPGPIEDVGPDTPDPLQFSDVNDADQFDPSVFLGRIPDHTATAEPGQPDLSAPGETPAPSRKRMPWEKGGLLGGSSDSSSAPKSSPSPGRRKKEPTDPNSVPPLPKTFEGDLADIYRTIGMFLSPVDPVCGKAIVDSAPACAESLVKYAKSNADVRRILHKLVGTSAMGAIMVAHTPILMAVVGHHIMPMVNARNTPAHNGYGVPVSGENEEFPDPVVRPFPTQANGSPFSGPVNN